jgi:hypothetical protein
LNGNGWKWMEMDGHGRKWMETEWLDGLEFNRSSPFLIARSTKWTVFHGYAKFPEGTR